VIPSFLNAAAVIGEQLKVDQILTAVKGHKALKDQFNTTLF